ncbi:MAG TPA: dihydrolipoyl dehydrogenase [Candidatus Cloacimonadota bacterium]|nr:dihydrolipoyl dehydrogenase [Candidatus Cloacimonadota bacterium]HQB41556.1 dihydrolipoyl dehydrogenase [Candidatus Cloacimonadota bacterium]
MEHYQVAVIGGGPGGYETAIRLSQYNINTVCFEKERLGGVCLNWGCIPTKALVKSADLFAEIKQSAEFGIEVDAPKLDFTKVYQRKAEVVEKLVSGIEYIFKKRNIPMINKKVEKIVKHDGKYAIYADNEAQCSVDYIVLATGSIPKELPFMPFDGKHILSSNDILNIEQMPESIAIIGGGVIGCEFASIFAQFGTKVEIIEFLPELIATEDTEISRRLALGLKKLGIKINLRVGVEKAEIADGKVTLSLANGKTTEAEKVLVAVGRQPVCDIVLEGFEIGKERDFIVIDEQCRTNEQNVFSIGDITGKMQLAHTASKQGLRVAELINGELNGEKVTQEELIYHNIPRCVFTNPELASCGLTEKQAQEQYDEILIGKFPYAANGKSLGMGNNFGFVKTIADKNSGVIVGMHIIGPAATEIIAQASFIINTKSSVESIEKVVFAHPTLSECVMESIEDLHKFAIHIV